MHQRRSGDAEPIPQEVEAVATELVDAALTVHRHLGPGLLESLYQQALVEELTRRQVPVLSEVPVRASYRGRELDGHFRLDLLVDDAVIVEVKAVEEIHPTHEAQLLTYLSLTGHRVGFLINFQTELMKDGIHRRVL